MEELIDDYRAGLLEGHKNRVLRLEREKQMSEVIEQELKVVQAAIELEFPGMTRTINAGEHGMSLVSGPLQREILTCQPHVHDRRFGIQVSAPDAGVALEPANDIHEFRAQLRSTLKALAEEVPNSPRSGLAAIETSMPEVLVKGTYRSACDQGEATADRHEARLADMKRVLRAELELFGQSLPPALANGFRVEEFSEGLRAWYGVYRSIELRPGTGMEWKVLLDNVEPAATNITDLRAQLQRRLKLDAYEVRQQHLREEARAGRASGGAEN